jgi:hypothetical protein
MAAIFPVASKEGGTTLGMPDVCKVPLIPIPVPLPAIGMLMQAKKTKSKVKIRKKNTVVKNCEIDQCQGDEVGILKGIISNKNMNKVVMKMASSKVKADGTAVYHLVALATHNGTQNANMPAGLKIGPSQTKVLVAP